MQVTTLAVVWIMITLSGTIMSGRVLYECYVDLKQTRDLDAASARRKLAEIAVIGEFSRFFTQLVLTILGFLAVINPLRWFSSQGVEIYVNIISGVFIAVALVLMVTSALWNVYRKMIINADV